MQEKMRKDSYVFDIIILLDYKSSWSEEILATTMHHITMHANSHNGIAYFCAFLTVKLIISEQLFVSHTYIVCR